MKPRLPWDACVVAAMMLVAAGGFWIFDRALSTRALAGVAQTSGSDLQSRFPLPAPFHPPEEQTSVLLRIAAQARPFSSHRGEPPPSASLPDGSTAPAAAAPPVFVYKGVVVMGTLRRAIVEDAASKKTYFLQVGQEVAGFKVLDIDESRVLLSQPNTQEQMVVSRSPTTSP